jgi:hypothetical protein
LTQQVDRLEQRSSAAKKESVRAGGQRISIVVIGDDHRSFNACKSASDLRQSLESLRQ